MKFLLTFLLFTNLVISSLFSQNINKKHLMVDSVVAIINDEIITMTDFQRSLIPLVKQLKGSYTGNELNQKIIEASKTILSQLIENKLILQTAINLNENNENFKIPEKEILTKAQQIIDRFPSKEVFEETLRKENLSFEDFKKDCMEQILAQQLVMKEVSSKLFISNEDIQKNYQENIELYTTPAKITFYQIWLKKKGNDQELKDLLKTILKKLEEGAHFKTLAAEYSEGPHAQDGGLWKDVVKGQFMPELDNAIWKLSPAQISPIIETDVSFHLIKVELIQKPNTIPIKDVWDKIKYKIRAQKGEKVRSEWIKKLKQEAYIEVFFEPEKKA